MIRLVFVSTLAYNYFFPGRIQQAGGHTRIYTLSKAFARRPDYKVFCLTGDFGQEKILKKDGVTLVKAPIDWPGAFFKVARAINKLKPDILVDFCASPRLFLYRLMKTGSRMKYVFLTCCDNDANGNYRETENFFYDFFYRHGLKGADRIICQVPEHQVFLKKNYGMRSELVLSPYFDMKQKRVGIKEHILWVGRAAYYKRPELFLELAEKHPAQSFVMICNKSGYDRGFFEKMSRQGFLPRNLEFHEYVPYPEMENYYRCAKVLVNTSDYEGFSNTFIEAAISKTPVLSLNSDPNGMLSVHGGGIACSGCMEQFVEKCGELISNEAFRKLLGQNAYDYAWRYHRIEHAVEQFDHIFRSIM